MAQVLGEAGRYVRQEAVQKRHKMLVLALVCIGLLSSISGFLFGTSFRHFNVSPLVSCCLSIGLLGVSYAIAKHSIRNIEDLDKERRKMNQGAEGELKVASILEELPQAFKVINDISTCAGNLDHVVVGPTGVFAIETKNWRGVVSSAKGELLINGETTVKPVISQFAGRIMRTREQIMALAPGLDPFFQGVFVFTSASLEARWGTTGCIHCLRDQQLFDYIVNGKRKGRLTSQEVDRTAHAFAALARMDKDFCERVYEARQ